MMNQNQKINMLADFSYQDDEVKIRPIELNDFHDYYLLYNDFDNMKYLSIDNFENDKVAFYMLKNLYFSKEYESYGYVIIKDSRVVGLFDIFEIVNNSAQISYILLPEYQKKGIMGKVLKIFIKYLKKNTQIYEICAKILNDNFQSLKLLNNLGFEKAYEEKMIIKDKLEYLSCYKIKL